jgi:hypothetical protein
MLIRRRQQFWVSVALLFLGAAILLFPSYAQYCEGNYPGQYICAAYDITVSLGYFVEAHNGAFTAVASIAIAAFTYTLYAATTGLVEAARIQASDMKRSVMAAEDAAKAADKSTDAGRRNIDAFMSAEKAHLFIEIKGETIAKLVSTYGRWDKSEGMFADEVDTPSVAYFFMNIGKTAAILKEISNQLTFQAAFPKVADYIIREAMPDQRVVMPGASSMIMTCLMQDTFTVGKCVDFQKRKSAFWFYGYVKFDDVFGREHEWRYRFSYKRGYGGLRLDYFREFPGESETGGRVP